MEFTSSVKRTRFFVLQKNQEIKEFSSIENALACADKQLVIVDKFKEFFTPPHPPGGYSDTWRLPEFIFKNEDNVIINLCNNSWIVQSIKITYKSANRLEFEVRLSDPLKNVEPVKDKLPGTRKHGDTDSHDIEIIRRTLNILHERSKFHSWEHFYLFIKNANLKRRIELLQKRIAHLETKVKQ